jgi:hypothetical protein
MACRVNPKSQRPYKTFHLREEQLMACRVNPDRRDF